MINAAFIKKTLETDGPLAVTTEGHISPPSWVGQPDHIGTLSSVEGGSWYQFTMNPVYDGQAVWPVQRLDLLHIPREASIRPGK
jgi:hypothetical protein